MCPRHTTDFFVGGLSLLPRFSIVQIFHTSVYSNMRRACWTILDRVRRARPSMVIFPISIIITMTTGIYTDRVTHLPRLAVTLLQKRYVNDRYPNPTWSEIAKLLCCNRIYVSRIINWNDYHTRTCSANAIRRPRRMMCWNTHWYKKSGQ